MSWSLLYQSLGFRWKKREFRFGEVSVKKLTFTWSFVFSKKLWSFVFPQTFHWVSLHFLQFQFYLNEKSAKKSKKVFWYINFRWDINVLIFVEWRAVEHIHMAQFSIIFWGRLHYLNERYLITAPWKRSGPPQERYLRRARSFSCSSN